MERIVLASPEIVPQIVNSEYAIASVLLDVKGSRIIVTFEGTNGETRQWIVEGALAMTRLKAIRTANLSVKSMDRWIFELARTDGVFAGTIAGTPDV